MTVTTTDNNTPTIVSGQLVTGSLNAISAVINTPQVNSASVQTHLTLPPGEHQFAGFRAIRLIAMAKLTFFSSPSDSRRNNVIGQPAKTTEEIVCVGKTASERFSGAGERVSSLLRRARRNRVWTKRKRSLSARRARANLTPRFELGSFFNLNETELAD